ncbi:MAG TPA: aminoglycoside phosphotransferase family protein [Gaiellaceae bacterium]|nr:aminoglycoside phosphotransferase family protein [Gaiellaceae bacterium]
MPLDLTETKLRAARIAREWQLDVDEPFSEARHSFAAPVENDRVLKVHWEGDTESLHEAEALELWDGHGAVRLLRKGDRALLEERAVPGTDIAGLPDEEATAIAIDVAMKLWRRAGAPFRPVADEVPRWLDEYPSELTPLARELWSSFDPGSEWLVHGDFHHQNILRHGDGYVAIDAKPYLADREYDVYSWLYNPIGYTMDLATTERRIAMFAAAGLDEERIRIWTVVRGAYLSGQGVVAEVLRALV